MKTEKAIQQFFKEMIAVSQQEGLDLTTDSITYSFGYKEYPGVYVTIVVGGMMREEITEDEDLH